MGRGDRLGSSCVRWRDDDAAAAGPAGAIATAVQGSYRGEMQDGGPETKYGHDHMRLLVDEKEEEGENLFLFCSGDKMQRQQPVSLQLRHVTTKIGSVSSSRLNQPGE